MYLTLINLFVVLQTIIQNKLFLMNSKFILTKILSFYFANVIYFYKFFSANFILFLNIKYVHFFRKYFKTKWFMVGI